MVVVGVIVRDDLPMWLAGFLDAEGSIIFKKRDLARETRTIPVVVIYQKDPAVFDEISEAYGGSLYFVKTGYNEGCHRWVLTAETRVRTLLQDLLPHLRIKHDKAIRALELLVDARGDGLANRDRDRCPSGHAYDERNTYVYKGHRHCRACRNAATQRRDARRKDNAAA